jgi:hypothetical protein
MLTSLQYAHFTFGIGQKYQKAKECVGKQLAQADWRYWSTKPALCHCIRCIAQYGDNECPLYGRANINVKQVDEDILGTVDDRGGKVALPPPAEDN